MKDLPMEDVEGGKVSLFKYEILRGVRAQV